ncbi:MAG: 16S rRNA (cytosine(1402)-N(4))-methyltransferase RsmH [Syntrophales bacterium]|nr:16S rRNA (cytosine(1402)-N(4))-methyltransferase RsmH [Syntrophales bacterium]
MEKDAFHKPVMKDEVVNYLNCRAGGIYVDGTVGGGSHARAILETMNSQGLLICIDRDEEAINEAKENLRSFSSNVVFVHDNFSRIKEILAERKISQVDGVLLDLGVSSHQLLSKERGFSFSLDGPLDMRMDKRERLTAHTVVNTFPEETLKEIIRDYGEERWASRIARSIVERREIAPISTTKELADLVVSAIPPSKRKMEIHPATRTFMALRIYVNKELEALKDGLSGAMDCLSSGGRLVVIAFHSLEDRMVKEAFREAVRSCNCPPGTPICSCTSQSSFRLVTKKAIRPSPEELEENPRARSAKLRALERI